MLLALLCAAAVAAPGDAAAARVQPALWRHARAQPDGVVAVVETAHPDAVAWLEDQGFAVQAVAAGAAQVLVPSEAVGRLADCPGARTVRRPWVARPKDIAPTGLAVTEGLAALFGPDDWHAAGIDGRGIDVAIVDVGFAGWETTLELPEGVQAHLVSGDQPTGHGVAAAEIVADVAPGARLHLYQFRTDIELLELLERLPDDGIDVVNASIGFDNVWPADGTSAVSRGVTALVDQGVVWVGAAGNEVGRYAIGPLSEVDGDDDGVVALGGAVVHRVEAAEGVSLRWTEPIDEATWDLDLAAWPTVTAWERGEEPCAIADDPQAAGSGAPPYEVLGDGCDGRAAVVVTLAAPGEGDLSDLEGFLYAPSGLAGGPQATERTLTLPADAHRAVAVGSCDLDGATYRSSGFSDRYSSHGPTEDGRLKPDVCAAGSVTTGGYGERGFVGTSAASPHIAALAALTLQAEGLRGAPEAFIARLHARAEELGDPGPDERFGHGGARAGDVAPRCACASGGASAPLWAALLSLVACIRRRKPTSLAASRPQG